MFRSGIGWSRGRARPGLAALLLPCALQCGNPDDDLFPEPSAGIAGVAGRSGENRGGEGGLQIGTAGEGGIGSEAFEGEGGGGVSSAGGRENVGVIGEDVAAGGAAGGEGEETWVPQPRCRLEFRCDAGIVDEEKRPCAAEIFSDDASVYQGFAGVELRGRTSQAYPKKNYSIELRTESGGEDARNLFSMGKESDWILDGSWVDRSFMRNTLAFDLHREAGHFASKSRYCTLRLNDEEQGVYRLGERIKRDDDRVDIAADDGTGRSFVIKQDTGGALELNVGAHSPEWRLIYPKESSATDAQRAGVQGFLDELEAAIAQAETSGRVFSLLDLDATTDWILLQELSKNIDGYHLSLHLTRDSGGLAKFVPWDFDLAFGQPTLSGETNESPEGWVHNRTRLIEALASRAELRERLGTRWQELRAGPFSDARVTQHIDRYLAALDPSDVARNFEIWPLADVDFSPIYPPYTLYPVGSYPEEVEKLRDWIRDRMRFLDDHIEAFPD